MDTLTSLNSAEPIVGVLSTNKRNKGKIPRLKLAHDGRLFDSVNDAEHTRGSWRDEEDDVLRDIILRFGAREWTTISAKMAAAGFPRAGKQCRERWFNHLDPAVCKEPWTPEEDEIIIRMHHQEGNKWTKIASCLKGRPANAVKNHWNSTLKRNLHTKSNSNHHSSQSPSLKRPRDETEDDAMNASSSDLSPRNTSSSQPAAPPAPYTLASLTSSFSLPTTSSSFSMEQSRTSVDYDLHGSLKNSTSPNMATSNKATFSFRELDVKGMTRSSLGSRTKRMRVDSSRNAEVSETLSRSTISSLESSSSLPNSLTPSATPQEFSTSPAPPSPLPTTASPSFPPTNTLAASLASSNSTLSASSSLALSRSIQLDPAAACASTQPVVHQKRDLEILKEELRDVVEQEKLLDKEIQRKIRRSIGKAGNAETVCPELELDRSVPMQNESNQSCANPLKDVKIEEAKFVQKGYDQLSEREAKFLLDSKDLEEEDIDSVIARLPRFRDPLQQTEPGSGYLGHFCAVQEQDSNAYFIHMSRAMTYHDLSWM